MPPDSIEQKLIDAIAQRKPCDFSTGTDADEIDNSLQWGPERTIDSSLLRKALIGSEAGYSLTDQPLEIRGARIVGIVPLGRSTSSNVLSPRRLTAPTRGCRRYRSRSA